MKVRKKVRKTGRRGLRVALVVLVIMNFRIAAYAEEEKEGSLEESMVEDSTCETQEREENPEETSDVSQKTREMTLDASGNPSLDTDEDSSSISGEDYLETVSCYAEQARKEAQVALEAAENAKKEAAAEMMHPTQPGKHQRKPLLLQQRKKQETMPPTLSWKRIMPRLRRTGRMQTI